MTKYAFIESCKRLTLGLGLVATLALATACSTAPPEDKTKDWNAEQLYRVAKKAIDSGNFETAIDYFEKLEARYPYGDHAVQAKLDIAYAYYKNEEYDTAIASAERFLKLHPSSENADYAYYLKGLSYYERGKGLLEKYFPRDMAATDQTALQKAFDEFGALISRYPGSRYLSDAKQRMVFITNEMARHEHETAAYYFERGAMTATVNRINYLLTNFPNYPKKSEALKLLQQAYLKQGLDELAQSIEKIILLN